MCDTEEISFIDDDPCDIIVDDNPDNVTKDESGDNQVDNLKNMQQIVIKINNEIELASIIVNTRNQCPGDSRQDSHLSKNLSLQEEIDTEDMLHVQVQEEREGGLFSENSDMSKTLTSEKSGDQLSFYQVVCSTGFLTHHRQTKSQLSRRNVLVCQEKLDCDFHPGLARKRHSFVPENHARHRLAKKIRKTATL